MLRFDDDYAVSATNAVERQAGRVFQHFHRRDIGRIDSYETAVRSGLDRQPVNNVKRLGASVDRSRAANPDREPAAGGKIDRYAGDVHLQQLLDWLRGTLGDIVSGYPGAPQWTGRGRIPHGISPRRRNAAATGSD